MRKTLVAVLFCALALPVAAQTAGPSVSQFFRQKPKSGHEQQFEAARKKHMAFHKTAGDPWTWHTWEILSGPDTGVFVIGTLGHSWKDFDRDEFDARDTADANANVSPHAEYSTMALWTYRADMSLSPEAKPTKYWQITHYYMKPDAIPAFVDAVKQVNEAIKKTNYPAAKSRWYMLVNGGEGPRFSLVQERNSFAEFEPPEKSLRQAVDEAYGAEKGADVWKRLTGGFSSVRSFILRYRPDLGYTPAGAD